MTRAQQDELYRTFGHNIAINDLTEVEADELIQKLESQGLPCYRAISRRMRGLNGKDTSSVSCRAWDQV